MKRRSLTPDEEKLWNEVTRGDKKLPGGKKLASSALLAGEGGVGDKSPRVLASNIRRDFSLPKLPSQGGKGIIPGDRANIDRNTADRFRKGELPMDATLDLHGMNREKAYNALMRFIHNQYARGSRCVLVITGKGVKSSTEEGRGVLREMLPGWLGIAEIQPMILALNVARPKHGGSGAWYVLLRRQRK